MRCNGQATVQCKGLITYTLTYSYLSGHIHYHATLASSYLFCFETCRVVQATISYTREKISLGYKTQVVGQNQPRKKELVQSTGVKATLWEWASEGEYFSELQPEKSERDRKERKWPGASNPRDAHSWIDTDTPLRTCLHYKVYTTKLPVSLSQTETEENKETALVLHLIFLVFHV